MHICRFCSLLEAQTSDHTRLGFSVKFDVLYEQMLMMAWCRHVTGLSHVYDPKQKILMIMKSLKNRFSQHTHTHTCIHTCTENMKGVYEDNQGHWVFMGIILWEMLHRVRVQEPAILSLCTSLWAFLSKIILLPSGPVPQPPSPGPPSQDWALCLWTRARKTQWVERYQIIKIV